MTKFACRAYLLKVIAGTTLIVATAFLSACVQHPESFKKPDMTTLSPRLQSLFETTKTVCFGRFVIDIPATATQVFGAAGEAGPEIFYLAGAGDQVAQYVAADLAEAENDRKFLSQKNAASLPLFGKVLDGIVPGQKLTINSKDQVGYFINSYISLGNDLFIQHIGSVLPKNYDASMFNDIARHLRLRTEDEIPTEPGSCIAGGFLPIPLDYERVSIGIRLKELPDVHLSIEVHKNGNRLEAGADLETLLKEGEAMARAEGHSGAYARIKTFRRGPRQLGPWQGSEMLARKPAYKKDTEAHEFYFHSLGAVNDPLQPQIDIRLDSGVKGNATARTRPSITDEEAVALWDKLIGTIRVRPIVEAATGIAVTCVSKHCTCLHHCDGMVTATDPRHTIDCANVANVANHGPITSCGAALHATLAHFDQ